MRLFSASLLALSVSLSASAASAAAWQALVIGQPTPEAGDTAFADAFYVTQALDRGGLNGIVTLRDTKAETVNRNLEQLAGTERLTLFFAGKVVGDDLHFGKDVVNLSEVLRKLASAGTREVSILIENCASKGAIFETPAIPEGLTVELISSVAPGANCSGAPRLSDSLRSLGNRPELTGSVAGMLQANWSGGNAPGLFELPGRVAEDWLILETEPVSRIANDIVSLTPVIDTGLEDSQILPASFSPPASNQAQIIPASAETVVVFAAPPKSQLTATPLSSGLPQPSIIIGLIEGISESAFAEEGSEEDDPALKDRIDIAFDNIAARRKLRDENGALFESLLAAGSFDPPADQLVVALQTELKRMNCYRKGIDGDWGPGSQSGVTAYFKALKENPPSSLQATTDLFRQIVRKDNVACPDPAPARVASRPKPQSTGTASRPRPSAPKPKPAPKPPAPAPKPPARSGGIQTGGSFVGSF